MILKLGIATVALTGGYLLASGKIDIITFFHVPYGCVENL